jgi:lysosomal alpha-mannosidase
MVTTRYWTGYFTSRPALKLLVRQGSAYLRAARTLRVLAGTVVASDNEDKRNDNGNDYNYDYVPNPKWPLTGGLDQLAAAVGVGAHHDAITGTERQPVANDCECLSVRQCVRVCVSRAQCV